MATTIKFPKSDSFAFFVTINKISHLLDNAFFTVKENPNEEPVLQKKLGAGISLIDNRLYKNQLSYKVQIDGADTQFMVVGARYFFDVKGTIGNAQKTFLWGELILSETETGYISPAIQGDTVAIAETYTATFETGAQSQYVETESDPVAMAKIGDMTKLNTTAKDTLVKAINEVNAPTFTEAANLENVVSGEKQSTLWGKVKKWFSSLKALAFKDKVGTADINDGAVTGTKIQAGAISDTQIAYAGISSTRIAKKAITTEKFAADAKCPNADNAKKVNNLEITSDANGVLKIGDIVIPQRKKLFSTDTPLSKDGIIDFGTAIPKDKKLGVVVTLKRNNSYYLDAVEVITKCQRVWSEDVIYLCGIAATNVVGKACEFYIVLKATDSTLQKFKYYSSAVSDIDSSALDVTNGTIQINAVYEIIE